MMASFSDFLVSRVFPLADRSLPDACTEFRITARWRDLYFTSSFRSTSKSHIASSFAFPPPVALSTVDDSDVTGVRNEIRSRRKLFQIDYLTALIIKGDWFPCAYLIEKKKALDDETSGKRKPLRAIHYERRNLDIASDWSGNSKSQNALDETIDKICQSPERDEIYRRVETALQ